MGKRLRILFLSTRWPLPPVTGDRLRCYYILRELAKFHDVTLVSYYSSRRELDLLKGSRIELDLVPIQHFVPLSYVKTLRTAFSRKPLQLGYFNFRALRTRVKKELDSGKYDLVFACTLRAAQFVEDVDGIPKVVDLIDAISLNYDRLLSFPGINRRSPFYFIYSIERKRVRRYEEQLLRKFDRIFLVSDVDRKYLAQFAPVDRVQVVANGVNLDYFHLNSQAYNPLRIVFHGNIHYPPNADAVLHFYHDIFPLVREKVPNAQFCVVGNRPRRSVEELSRDPGVLVTGRVNDVRTYLWDACVAVAPMRIGAGIQNKILESMGSGVPVVSSSLGYEGLDAVPGKHLFVADDPREFAERVVYLMRNPKGRQQMASQARRWVAENCSWPRRLAPLLQTLQDLA